MKNSVHNCNFHITLIPKYRKPFLIGRIKYYIEKSILQKSQELSIKIEKIEILPDHLHMFIRIKPTQCISIIINQLKGYSSYYTRKKLNLYKYKALWAHGYFCESIGQISESIIIKYIENQWKHYNPNSSPP